MKNQGLKISTLIGTSLAALLPCLADGLRGRR